MIKVTDVEMTKRSGNKWMARLDDAQKYRKEKLVDNVERYLALYRGDHWGRISQHRRKDLITVNLVFPLIRNQIGYFYFRDPKMFVKPRPGVEISEETTSLSEITAPVVESALNYYWTEMNARRQQRFRIYDTLIFGHSIAEIGWRFETDVVKVKGKNERIFYNEYIKKDAPYLQRISPLRFLHDPKVEMDPIVNSEWVGKEFFSTIDDVKNNPMYKNTDKLEAHITTTDQEKDRFGETVVKLVEVHDRKHMKLSIFAMGFDKPLREVRHPYEDILEGHNFEWLQFNHVPDEDYGISQISLMEDQQHELNRTRTQMFHHRRRVSNRRYIFEEGSISENAISQLEDAEGGAMVAVGNIDRIKPLEDARMSNDVPFIESVIKQDIRELTGQPASQFGVLDNKARSATEMGQIQNAVDFRNLDNLTLVEEDTRNCARKVVQLLKANADRETMIKVVGPRGSFWHGFTKEEIQGEYDVLIDPGSTTKENDAVRRKQSTDLLGIAVKVPGLNLREFVTDVLQTFDKTDTGKYFGPNFDQMHGLIPQGQGAGGRPAGVTNPQLAQEDTPDATRLATDASQLGDL